MIIFFFGCKFPPQDRGNSKKNYIFIRLIKPYQNILFFYVQAYPYCFLGQTSCNDRKFYFLAFIIKLYGIKTLLRSKETLYYKVFGNVCLFLSLS